METIKPCPFCGHTGIDIHIPYDLEAEDMPLIQDVKYDADSSDGFYIECSNCVCQMGIKDGWYDDPLEGAFKTLENAVEVWNKRA